MPPPLSSININPNLVSNIFLHRDLAEFYLRQKLLSHAQKKKHHFCSSKQIPKIIHYAWFGDAPIPKLCLQCIDSWHKIHPDWEFKLWNELNFPFNLYPYAKEALERRCWAFVSDVARLHAVYNYGGIYLDTDVRTIKSFEDLINLGFFACFEGPTQITISTFGAKQHHPYVGLLLDWYRMIHLRSVYLRVANVRFISKITRLFYDVKLHGKKNSFENDVHIFPREYFCPKPIGENWDINSNTYAIHIGTGTWL